MHQPRRALTFLVEFRNTTTVPRSRPWGRRTLYASRTTVLILSADTTVTFVSEYNNTASVFSSWAGTGTLTRACIHCGASPAAACGAYPRIEAQASAAAQNPTGKTPRLVTGLGSAGLQDNLLFIGFPHDLEEIPQGCVVLEVEQNNLHANLPAQVQCLLIAFCLQGVGDRGGGIASLA